jgi:hypothetical protein
MSKLATLNSVVALRLVLLILLRKCVTLNNAEAWDIGSTTTVFSPMADFKKHRAMNTIMKLESLF